MLSLQKSWTVQDRVLLHVESTEVVDSTRQSVVHVESTGVVDNTGQERVAC